MLAERAARSFELLPSLLPFLLLRLGVNTGSCFIYGTACFNKAKPSKGVAVLAPTSLTLVGEIHTNVYVAKH